MKTYIAYYRISTQHQLRADNTSLGIESQRTAVKQFIGDGVILKEYIEVESGKKANRPILEEAIKEAQATKSCIVINKIDRISRSLSFLLALKDRGIEFRSIDMPELNLLNLSILGALAQRERELTSQRTKDCMAELKRKGVKVGSPENMTDEARAKGSRAIIEKAKTNIRNRQATAVILNCKEKNMKLSGIAIYLNQLGYKTSKGCEFTAMAVKRLFERSNNELKMVA